MDAFDLQFLLIPLVAAVVGYVTNRLAIHMTFKPLKFVGLGPFGWQGIIPSKAPKMAGKAVELLTSKLLDIEAQFEKLDPDQMTEEMHPQLRQISRSIIDEAMQREFPVLWNVMPSRQKEVVYEEAEKHFPKTMRNVFSDLKQRLHTLFDLRDMMVTALTNDPTMMNRVFWKCGEREFRFIERSGLYFGFLFGVVQMVIWSVYQAWWILPLGGLLVGYITNWLALKLIFRPKEPIGFGPVRFQGLFMKRQNEVAAAYAAIIATEILTFEKMFQYMMRNKGSDALADLAQAHIGPLVDSAAGSFGATAIRLASGSRGYERIKHMAAERVLEALPLSVHATFDYADSALNIRVTIEDSMKRLTPDEFEGVLRPIFQEDELTLILVGAALGLAAGCLQVVFLVE